MRTDDVITNALKLASGARFVRCALQVNPGHYGSTYRGADHDHDTMAYAKAIVDKAEELDVSVLAITDHNSVCDISAFQAAAEDTDITILPGFELESTEGIHVLCIYPPDTPEVELERLLGEFGVRKPEPSSDQCGKEFIDILGMVRDQGGVTIAAHSTGRKGLFQVLDGQARIRAWRCEDLLAVQVPGSIDDLLPERQDVRDIISNMNPDYGRSHAAGQRQAVAVVNAKDVARPDDLDGSSATCWIKMSEVPSCDALRQAFLDPDSRIRLNSDEVPEEHSELLVLTWEGGGFLDGAAIHFNQNLNVLIGGRGTGKSTVIESLRYVLDLEPDLEEARTTYQGIVRHVIKPGTKVSLLVRVFRPAERTYKIERTVPNPPVVLDHRTGEVLQLLPKDILPKVEVYGQHEISELTNNEEKLTSLLRRFVEADKSLQQRKSELLRELKVSRRDIVQAQTELDDTEERLAELPRLEETLARFQEAGVEEQLRVRSLVVREERILQSVSERTQVFRDALEMLRQDLPVDVAFLSNNVLVDLPGGSILGDAEKVLKELSGELEKVAQQLRETLERADQRIEGIRRRWSEHKREVDVEYDSILRRLQKSSSAVDGEEFIRLRHDIEKLKPLAEKQKRLEQLIGGHQQRRHGLLVEWEDLKAGEFRYLDRAARQVNAKLKDRVEVGVFSAGNRRPLADLLTGEIQGRLSEAISVLRETEDLSLPEFVDSCRKGADHLKTKYAFTSRQAQLLAEASEDTLMQIEELELPATTELRLNTAGVDEQPSWASLKELSKGQKATAVLLLLLLESEDPLIIDQPEDDLDNRFITEGVVPRIREEKRRRQFVFATHNANIPVLGDAELILGLQASGEAEDGEAFIANEHRGSIDSPSVRALVEEVLEGGKNAFEIRRRKYGF